MSWSYDLTKLTDATQATFPDTTIGVRYQIRLLLQDTQTNRQLLQDEEIDWIQTQEANVYMMAAQCCDILVAKAGMIHQKRTSEFWITYDVTFYRDLALRLRARGLNYQIPYVGGTSISGKEAQRADPDWLDPLINRGQGDNPAAPSPVQPPINPLTQY